jgi:membrane associated rhomboid family serine protease
VIPLQDVIPTRRTPVVTIGLIVVNLGVLALDASGLAGPVPALLMHRSVVLAGFGLLFLWLFGDNVEARLGRGVLVLLYAGGALVANLGPTGGVTAVIGSYFMLLPRSRILVLAPVPELLVEVPALFFLGVWAVLHLPMFVSQPSFAAPFGAVLLLGGAVARVMRPQIRWS